MSPPYQTTPTSLRLRNTLRRLLRKLLWTRKRNPYLQKAARNVPMALRLQTLNQTWLKPGATLSSHQSRPWAAETSELSLTPKLPLLSACSMGYLGKLRSKMRRSSHRQWSPWVKKILYSCLPKLKALLSNEKLPPQTKLQTLKCSASLKLPPSSPWSEVLTLAEETSKISLWWKSKCWRNKKRIQILQTMMMKRKTRKQLKKDTYWSVKDTGNNGQKCMEYSQLPS